MMPTGQRCIRRMQQQQMQQKEKKKPIIYSHVFNKHIVFEILNAKQNKQTENKQQMKWNRIMKYKKIQKKKKK